MRSSGIVRAEHSPSHIEPQAGQVTEDGSEVARGKKPWDVLQQREARSYSAKDCGGLGPEVAGVVGSGSLAGDGEGLAGEAARNHVRNAAIALGRSAGEKVAHVTEDGGRIKNAIRDARRENRLAVGLDFDVADSSPAEEAMGAEESSAGAGEEGELTHTPTLQEGPLMGN
jgi:hypothetical protein